MLAALDHMIVNYVYRQTIELLVAYSIVKKKLDLLKTDDRVQQV